MLKNNQLTIPERSHCFHASLALALVQQAKQVQKDRFFSGVGLTGGVFQNRLLTDYVSSLLKKEGFKVYLPEKIPGNDAGLSFGQLIEVGSQLTNL
jgi:hydrogenase maturation protein HypF